MRFNSLSKSTFLEHNFRYVHHKKDAYYLYKNDLDIELMVTDGGDEIKYHFRYNDKLNGMVYSTAKTNYLGRNDFVGHYYKIRHLMDFIENKKYSNFGGSAFDYVEEVKTSTTENREAPIAIEDREIRILKREFDIRDN